MTQAQKTFPGTTSLLPTALAAIVAAVAVSTAIVIVQLERPASGGQPTTQTQTRDQEVLDTGRAWEQQRIQQSAFGVGIVSDAVLNAAHEWERQQIQQSPGGLGRSTGTHGPTAPTPR
ncbi:MAG: hypothetical protein ABIZ57_11455 [Candidatus Limnocylindria bacterium]